MSLRARRPTHAMWDATEDLVRVCSIFSLVRTLNISTSSLDDGLTVGWSQTQRDLPFDKRKVSSDNLAVRSWGLGHQAGTFTYPHHDADGDATYVIVMSGVKLWTLYFNRDPTVSREGLMKIRTNLCDPDMPPSGDVCAETAYLYPGDLLYVFFLSLLFLIYILDRLAHSIQPPAQVHAVYTPVASFTIGGHFYSYDMCHLTEFGRYLDFQRNGELTNQMHHHALETLVRMVLGLPRLDPHRGKYLFYPLVYYHLIAAKNWRACLLRLSA
jgi:hypothetical protein